MKVIENVTMYKCDHCGKKQQRKHSMARHEEFCSRNPANEHACFNCKHLEVGTTKVFDSCDPEQRGTDAKTFQCKRLGIDLYTFKAEKMNLLQKYPEDFEEKHRMPLKCQWHEDEFAFIFSSLFDSDNPSSASHLNL